MKRAYKVVDVFTSRPFMGNPVLCQHRSPDPRARPLFLSPLGANEEVG